jgi:hypothetical protein
MVSLANKTALVTGASRGMGRATALALAREGAHIIVHYGRNAKEAKSVVDQTQTAGGRAEAVAADLAAADGAHTLAAQVSKLIGNRLDILVSNAGISKDGRLRTSRSRTSTICSPSISVRHTFCCNSFCPSSARAAAWCSCRRSARRRPSAPSRPTPRRDGKLARGLSDRDRRLGDSLQLIFPRWPDAHQCRGAGPSPCGLTVCILSRRLRRAGWGRTPSRAGGKCLGPSPGDSFGNGGGSR